MQRVRHVRIDRLELDSLLDGVPMPTGIRPGNSSQPGMASWEAPQPEMDCGRHDAEHICRKCNIAEEILGLVLGGCSS